MLSAALLDSPLGTLLAQADERGIYRLVFADQAPAALRAQACSLAEVHHSGAQQLLDALQEQIHMYFDGQRVAFTMPLRVLGTPFQRAVWEMLVRIPYGQTITYRDLALRCGDVRAVRAAAGAVAANPLLILIPCHRVLGVDHNLKGYAGGLERKEALLRLEGVTLC